MPLLYWALAGVLGACAGIIWLYSKWIDFCVWFFDRQAVGVGAAIAQLVVFLAWLIATGICESK